MGDIHPRGPTIESYIFKVMTVVNTRWGITTIARRGWRAIKTAIDCRASQFIYLTTSNRFHKSVLALGYVCTEIPRIFCFKLSSICWNAYNRLHKNVVTLGWGLH